MRRVRQRNFYDQLSDDERSSLVLRIWQTQLAKYQSITRATRDRRVTGKVLEWLERARQRLLYGEVSRSGLILRIWQTQLAKYQSITRATRNTRVTGYVLAWLKRVRDRIVDAVQIVGVRSLEQRNAEGFANAVELD